MRYEGWKGLVKEAPGHMATAAGFTLEDVNGLSGEKVVKAKTFIVAVRWDSMDSHASFRETDAAKVAFAELEKRSGVMEVHHVEFELMG